MKRHVSGLSVAVTMGFAAGTSLGENVQTSERMVMDAQGAHMVRTIQLGDEPAPPPGSPRGIELFTFTDDVAIAASVSLGGMDTSWVGQELNSERLQTFNTFGDGTPVWEYDYLPLNPDIVRVAASENGDFALSAVLTAGTVQVRGFDSTSSEPRWTYTFPAPLDAIGGLDVSRDGSVAAAAAFDFETNQCRVVVFDQNDGSEAAAFTYDFIMSALYLSMDGSRAVYTAGDTGRVIDMSDGSEIFSAAASGTGGRFKISADGTALGVGGFNLKLYREIDGIFTLIHSEQESTQWYGAAIGFSADGRYAIGASYNYINYTTLTYRIFDLTCDVELARTTTTGAAGFQDTLIDAAVNDEGTVFAVASWGLLNNEHPEVQFFDRQAQLIGGIDTPGSVFSMDMLSDGSVALSGSKEVHANEFGNGGDVVAYQVLDEVPVVCDGDVNSDGVVDPLDSGYVLSRFGCDPCAGDPDCAAADANEDTVVDPLDTGYVLSRFGTCD